MELMVEYGMKPVDVLKAATSVNAKALHMEQQVGMLKPGMLADIIIVGGDPSIQISVIRQVKFVMKDGVVYRQEK
jgi:imidazolonepropionase-like amidohydrolase